MRKGGKVTIPKLDWGAPVSTEISLLLAPFDDIIIGEFSWISRSDLRRHLMTTWILDSDDSDIFWDCVFRLEDWVELGLSLDSEGGGALMSGRGRETCTAGVAIPVFCLTAGLFEAIGTWEYWFLRLQQSTRHITWLCLTTQVTCIPRKSRPLSLWASAKSLPENRHWCARKQHLVSFFLVSVPRYLSPERNQFYLSILSSWKICHCAHGSKGRCGKLSVPCLWPTIPK